MDVKPSSDIKHDEDFDKLMKAADKQIKKSNAAEKPVEKPAPKPDVPAEKKAASKSSASQTQNKKDIVETPIMVKKSPVLPALDQHPSHSFDIEDHHLPVEKAYSKLMKKAEK